MSMTKTDGLTSNIAALRYFISIQNTGTAGDPAEDARKWDRRAKSWQRKRSGGDRGDARVDSALEFLEGRGLLGPECDVADIGCGPGRFAAAFGKRVRSVVGLDLSQAMVADGRAYVEGENLQNVQLRVCDFQTLDIDREGYRGAFDLVFCSMTPAVHNMEGLQKAMEMSRGYCCSITHLYKRSTLREQIAQEVFGGKTAPQRSGQWFYSLFNVLFLMGYSPETSYETRRQETRVQVDRDYAQLLMEQLLPPADCTPANGEKILTWLQRHMDPDGALAESVDAGYGRILWDVRRRVDRPDYLPGTQGV